MRVLVACESSGRVRRAFNALSTSDKSISAKSCDLLPPEDGNVMDHYQCDVREILNDGWDMLIAFPTCTYLCSSGMHWTVRGLRDPQLTEDALEFVRLLLGAGIPYIALENPVGAISTRIRKPDQIIHPWQFGHPESKTTCLWLNRLPPLQPTKICEKPASGRWANQTPTGQNKLGPSRDRWKERSRTYPGIAQAMAEQWSAFVLNSRTTATPAPIAENLFAWSAKNIMPIAPVLDLTTQRMTDGNSSTKAEPSTGYVLCGPDQS